MSTDIASLRASAVDARKQKQWQTACDKYSELLKAEYNDDEAALTLEICQDLTDYAYCMLREEEPDLEGAWECLENAKRGYTTIPDAPVEGLADVYEFLAEIGVKNRAYEEAVKQYEKILALCTDHPELSWRIGLNAHYMITVCLEACENLKGAAEAAQKAIDFANEARGKEENAKDVDAINEFARSITIKRASILEKIPKDE